jgi:hypothetical protein
MPRKARKMPPSRRPVVIFITIIMRIRLCRCILRVSRLSGLPVFCPESYMIFCLHSFLFFFGSPFACVVELQTSPLIEILTLHDVNYFNPKGVVTFLQTNATKIPGMLWPSTSTLLAMRPTDILHLTCVASIPHAHFS